MATMARGSSSLARVPPCRLRPAWRRHPSTLGAEAGLPLDFPAGIASAVVPYQGGWIGGAFPLSPSHCLRLPLTPARFVGKGCCGVLKF